MVHSGPDYPIHDVSDWPTVDDEPMGTKVKYWLRKPDDERWLFKQKHRPHSDDDWSEKIASELAGLFGIPHSTVALARRRGERGIITRDMVAERHAEELVPGNSLLVEADPDYPSGDFYHVPHHTIDRIFGVLEARCVGLLPTNHGTAAVADACDLFVGYLLFDAWIGNTDRHHENWAVLKFPKDRYLLAPSYDHAACLGHNVQDEQRAERLGSRDRNRQLTAYAQKARSAIYRTQTDRKAVSTDVAFALAGARRPSAGRYWLDRLRRIVEGEATEIVNWSSPRIADSF